MRMLYPTTALERLCGVFGKTRQAFYDLEKRDGKHQMEDNLLLGLIRPIKEQMPATGGHKLLEMLRPQLTAHGLQIGRDRFFQLLRNNGWLVRKHKRHTRTTWSDHPYRKWPDLIHNYQPTGPGQLWVSDITYIRIQSRFAYLSLITDAYSRKIIGFHLSQQLKVKGCLIALQKAIRSKDKLPFPQATIHHSDRGIQYCCDAYVNTLTQHGIQISMTQTGSPYDNAIAERVNGILKTELGLNQVFDNYGKAVDATQRAINLYNSKRLHMSCGNITPDMAHQQTGLLIKKWKQKTKKTTTLATNCKVQPGLISNL